ncbi:hypothetical protein GCM10025792_12260 [Pseudonocardia tropica]
MRRRSSGRATPAWAGPDRLREPPVVSGPAGRRVGGRRGPAGRLLPGRPGPVLVARTTRPGRAGRSPVGALRDGLIMIIANEILPVGTPAPGRGLLRTGCVMSPTVVLLITR